jgi:hypothetical protein
MSSIIRATTSSGLQVAPDNSGSLELQTNGTTTAVTIDTSQNVGIGTTSPASTLHVDNGTITTQRYGSTGALVGRSASGTQSSPTAISSSTGIGQFVARGYDGSAYRNTGVITFISDGAISSTSSPGYIQFATTPSGSVSSTERMRITSAGAVVIGNAEQSASPTAGILQATDGFGANITGASLTIQGGKGTGTGAGGALIFQTSSTGTAGSALNASVERMRIDSSGNLLFNSGYGSVATAYGCRAWVNFNGTGTPAIRASGNVTSITDNGTGDYTVNFTTAMTDANYSVNINASGPYRTSIGQAAFGTQDSATTMTTSAVRLGIVQVGGTAANAYDSANIFVSVFR